MTKWLDPCRHTLPVEAISHMPRVICYGTGKVLVEQHDGILTCREDEMAFQTCCGRLIIDGNDLELCRYGDACAIVLGEIRGVRYGGRTPREIN